MKVIKTVGYCCRIQFASLANLETLVFAIGFSFKKLIVRNRFIPVAVATSCKCVFSNPLYLERRIVPRRTPCESVPSIPARR